MKLSKQQLKTSTRHYIKKCAGAVCTSKLHESARNSNCPSTNEIESDNENIVLRFSFSY